MCLLLAQLGIGPEPDKAEGWALAISAKVKELFGLPASWRPKGHRVRRPRLGALTDRSPTPLLVVLFFSFLFPPFFIFAPLLQLPTFRKSGLPLGNMEGFPSPPPLPTIEAPTRPDEGMREKERVGVVGRLVSMKQDEKKKKRTYHTPEVKQNRPRAA